MVWGLGFRVKALKFWGLSVASGVLGVEGLPGCEGFGV